MMRRVFIFIAFLALAVACLILTVRQPVSPNSRSGLNAGIQDKSSERAGDSGTALGVGSSNAPTTLVATDSATAQASPSIGEDSQARETFTAPATRELGGLAARAFIGNNSVAIAPSEYGLFPSQSIGFNETVPLRVEFPSGTAGDLVIVQAEDGGQINGNAPVARMNLDSKGALAFTFTSTAEGGVYRITLRSGFDEKRLEFTTLPSLSAR